jgi:hypothetical protein
VDAQGSELLLVSVLAGAVRPLDWRQDHAGLSKVPLEAGYPRTAGRDRGGGLEAESADSTLNSDGWPVGVDAELV